MTSSTPALILAFLLPVTLMAADPVPVTSVVEAVKVFRQGASVTRSATVALPAGVSEVHFPVLSPYLDERTVQVEVSRGFTLHSVSATREFLSELPMPPAYMSLQEQIEKLEAAIRKDKAATEVLKEEEGLLLANRQVGGQQNGLNATQLEQVAQYFRTRLSAIKTDRIVVEERLGENGRQLDKLKKQQAELRQRLRPDNALTVVVRLQAQTAGKADLRITYLVRNAGWQSSYDLRVSDLTQPLGIESKGEVFNRTGEDWEQVRLTLSTGDPSRQHTTPALYPWWIDFLQPVMAYEKAMRMEAGNVRGVPDAAAADMVAPEALAQSSENLTTMEFAIRDAFTIPADGKPYTVLLEQRTAPAEYVHIAAPRVQPYAHLTATLRDFETYNLSSGKARIYYGQTFIGETWLDSRQSGDSLVLSLGADIGVAVSREKVKDKSSRNFFGNRVEESQGWVIRVRNNKSSPLRIRVLDQIPLSRQDDIKVEYETGPGASVSAETGVITWEYALSAGEQREDRFAYRVKYPKGKEIGW